MGEIDRAIQADLKAVKETKPPIFVVRRGDFLTPSAPLDGELIRAFPASKPLRAQLTMPRRSSPQNRLYRALLGLVCDNLEQDISPDSLHQWLKLRLHLTHEIRLRNGEVIEVTKSVAFDSMEQPEFNAYFNAATDLIVRQLLPGLSKPALEREARLMLGEPA